MPRIIRAFLTICLFTPAAVRGQSASSTAKAFFQAQTDKQWLEMADFVDSSSLRALRGIADKQIQGLSAMAKPEMRAKMDSMGAIGMAKTMDGLQAMLGQGSMLRFTFARVTDTTELQAMSDRELMGRWFEAKSLGYLLGLSGGMLKGLIATMPPPAGDVMQSTLDTFGSMKMKWEVVGEIAEGDSVAHVAFRIAGLTPPAPTGILTFRASGARWYIRFRNPDDQLGHLAALVMAAMQALQP